MNKKELYEYFTSYRNTLEKYILLNENFYQVLFLIFILILYIYGIKTDFISLFIILIICIFILDGIRLKIKTQKLLDKWDYDYKTNKGYFNIKK